MKGPLFSPWCSRSFLQLLPASPFIHSDLLTRGKEEKGRKKEEKDRKNLGAKETKIPSRRRTYFSHTAATTRSRRRPPRFFNPTVHTTRIVVSRYPNSVGHGGFRLGQLLSGIILMERLLSPVVEKLFFGSLAHPRATIRYAAVDHDKKRSSPGKVSANAKERGVVGNGEGNRKRWR